MKFSDYDAGLIQFILIVTIAVAVPVHVVLFLLWVTHNKKAIKTLRSVVNTNAPLKKYTET